MLIHKSAFCVSKVASKDVGRYAMNGVQLTRKGAKARATATDGRRLLVAEWTEPDHKDYPPILGADNVPVDGFATVVPTEAFDKIGKAIPRKSNKEMLHYATLHEPSANGHVKLATTDLGSVTAQEPVAIEGQFPPVDDVIPDYKIVKQEFSTKRPLRAQRAVEYHINAKLLREMLQAVESMRADDARPLVKLTIPLTAIRPMRIDATNEAGVTLTGVLMPVNPEA